MDCGSEYVRMCDCPEIQGSVFIGNGDGEWWREDRGLIWLPRQDQLQEMMKGSWSLHKDICLGFMAVFDGDPDLEIRCVAPTAEQALLQLVMFKLHSKKWNGEAWE